MDVQMRPVWLLLSLLLQCLTANAQGPGATAIRSRAVRQNSETGVQGRAIDTRVEFAIEEGQPADTLVGTIPIKPNFRYRFNEEPREFRLNATTGEIRTVGELDREALRSEKFDLVILSSQPTYPIEVRIVVIDINDNAPVFPEPSISISFSESVNSGTRVILDTASDGDAGENDVTTNYKIIGGNEDGKFKLVVTTNPSGETPYLHMETTGQLDREFKSNYQLNISAEDGGSPKLYGYLLVNIAILDVNDNPPIFAHSDYNVSLNESVPPGTTVLQVMASDSDDGDNARITYFLPDDQTQFEVDKETGVISTLDSLSCQQECSQPTNCSKSCVFTVFARDHGSPQQNGRTYVTVNLLDANDHDPIIKFRYFPPTAEHATVDENAQNGSVVAAVSVVDVDEGANRDTYIQITDGNQLNHFRLENSQTFDIVRVNGVLDREKINKYNLTIVATDRGTPPRSSTAFLIIQVNDINDHAPAFEKSEYSAVLSETVPVGTYVAGITATDEDTGINSNIFYAIVSGDDSQWFDIDVNTGLITTRTELDRELKDMVLLKITARDGGPNPKYAQTQLKVTILDENDEQPTFREPIVNISLSENTQPKTLVAIVEAVDNDQGTNGTVTYHFHDDVEADYPGTFALDPSSGRVTTKTKLDREAMPNCVIRVIARDQGVPPISATATINLELQDVNDNSPEIYPRQYFVTVPEGMKKGSPVTQVTATDRDEGENAVISYEITEGDDGTFEIEKTTGVIRLASKLSRSKKSGYQLTVSATDMGGRRALKDAVVEVVVDNDQIKALRFDNVDGYRFSVVEDPGKTTPATGRQVGKVAVTNAPDGVKVTYTIVSGDIDGMFAIDTASGDIKTAARIDREHTSSYRLTIAATGSGSFGETLVVIEVDDVNDSAPRFKKSRAVAHVEERRPIGYEVYLARATDTDAGDNSKITYSLSKNPGKLFDIDSETGMIYLVKKLERVKKGAVQLEVTAVDGGTPPLSAQQKVTMFIEDANDHTPVFGHQSYEASLLESTPVNDRFFSLTASDADHGRNGFVSYQITHGNELEKFGIFPDGYLYIKSALDREEWDYYAITVVATDHGDPPRSSTASVIIHVIDENDHAPVFANQTFDFYVSENEPPDSYVGKLVATDQDKGRNAELTFILASSSIHFTVDPKSGFVKTLHYFDREDLVSETGRDFFRMEAIVKDNGVERLQDIAEVNIHIVDTNDNAPLFTRLPERTQISELAPIGSLVARISATDADAGLNGDVVYALVDGNREEKFRVDASTGQLLVAGILDRETEDQYVLTVAAMDAAPEGSLTSTASITVDVLDENDNQPEFTQTEASISIKETTEIGTELMQFQATDPDLGINQEVSFGIASGSGQGTFRIDTHTGTLFLDKGLDFERTSVYNMNITASDAGKPRLTATITFAIFVKDVNDNPPAFPNTAIVSQIREGIKPGTAIVSVRATDPDSGDNGRVTYSIASQEPRGEHFGIKPDSGVIFVKGLIDREVADTYRLTILATDLAKPPEKQLSAQKLATVIVEDINDSAPEFVSMSAALLPENSRRGHVVMTVKAHDPDANTNGRVTYELADGDRSLFSLDRLTGDLVLIRDLASPAWSYQVTVTATDEAAQGQRKATDTVVTIIGKTGTPGPVFGEREYRANVYENQPIGTSVATVSASFPTSSLSDIEYYVTNVTSGGRAASRAFAVDVRRGVVSTAQVLDRESGLEQYEVEVTAILARGVTPQVTSVKVLIAVQDKNDSPPVFTAPRRQISVTEDLTPGSEVVRFSASDADTIGERTFSLQEGDAEVFRLQPKTGTLVLLKALDREEKQEYRLVVRASDGQQHTDQTFTLQVQDTNDNAPVFTRSAYSFDVAEDAARGARVGTVTAHDADLGKNGRVTYTVISDWDNDVFSLDTATGVFTLTSMLDYEQVQHYIFTVQAQDMGRPGLSSTVIVYINVLDLNDNEPLFDPQSYHDRVSEAVPPGTAVLRVSATDQDAGINGQLHYRIVGGDPGGQFRISSNGTVMTQKRLDREETAFYQLVVVAEDGAEPSERRLSSSVQVSIVVEDINDVVPEFISPNETSVEENAPANTVVMGVQALDGDEGRNGYVEYSLTEPADGPFILGTIDGLLRVSGPLDRELKANYSLVVTARDRGQPPKASRRNILVHIKDVNDNAPIFAPDQYSASIAENTTIGTEVLRCSATDADEGLNGRVRYSIIAGDRNRDFTISQDTGVVRVAKELNFERRSMYLLTIQAEDSAGKVVRYDTATATVSVTDINDNAPVFRDAPYLVFIMENVETLPAPLTTVVAYDADAAPFNTIQYSIKEGNRAIFQMDSRTGEISVMRALDREAVSEYRLVVAATDSGNPRLTGTGIVHVLVQDQNDHAPVFDELDYGITIDESLPPDTEVIRVTASDADDGVNALLRYSLVEAQTVPFAVDAVSGQVRTRAALDRELQSAYTLTLLVTDSSLTQPRTAATNVTVLLRDVNDSPPRFQQEEATVYLPDGAPAGWFVLSCEAEDMDEGKNSHLSYRLRGTDSDRFRLNSETGVIRTASALSGLERTFFVEVEASDGGTPSLTSTMKLHVKIKPAAQFPKFEPMPSSFRFGEEARDVEVTTVKAVSPRSGAAGQVRYRLAGGNVGDAFDLNPASGALRVSRLGLDYERTSQYRLWVEASDGGDPSLASVAPLLVNVTDFNDNAPLFTRSVYAASVLEEQYPPTLVLRVAATDADTADNAKIIYRLRPDGVAEEAFTLDAQSGEIFTQEKLDREQVDSYTLTVEAIDQGNPQQTGTAMVTIDVRDKNDNPPRFTRLFSVNVTENAEIGSFVIRVTSSDRDIGENANATYSFTENPGKKFAIDPVSGNVTVEGPVDREERDEYVLKVSAVDGSWRAETPLTITIQDMNDNAPLFEKSQYVFNVAETDSSVAFVGKLEARDRDKPGPNAVVSYALKQPSDFFSVDPSSGQLFSKQALRYKRSYRMSSPENQYNLEVIAMDHGKPPMSSSCTVTVNVVDANNNAPVFRQPEYFSPVPEKSMKGDKIVQVQADDKQDSGINALVRYQKLASNGSDFFTVDANTGWVSVLAPLTGRVGVQYLLRVRATDLGVPPQQDETRVILVVTPPNKLNPVFTPLSYHVIVPEEEPVATTIVSVTASDDDTGPNGMVRYRMAGGSDDGWFTVDEKTGVVSNARPLDFDVQDKYNLTIIATDLGFIPLTATAELRVTLTDIDDNPPTFNQSSYDAFIAENSPVGTPVIQLTASDRDSARNAVIKYSIIGGDGRELFAIDRDTGLVTSQRVFDYEKREFYTLDVLAANPGSSQRGQTKVKVAVTGINEFFPKFVECVFRFTVSESAEVGTSVGRLQATDDDDGVDGQVTYLLVGSSNDRGFKVDAATGDILVARRLDRESRNRVVLTALAKNAGGIRGNDTDEAQVSITIQDGNDPPQFQRALYSTQLSEGAAIGDGVIAVQAVDKDVQQQNNQFTYSIIAGNVGDVFKVDSQSGRIQTTKQLDRERVSEYNLTLGAIDNGSPPQTGTTAVIVTITDINDNGPTFDQTPVVGYVSENEPAGTTVMTLRATDPDLPPNGPPFSYYLVGGEHRNAFTVDAQSGTVRTARTLDREQTPQLLFTVEVHDTGRPRMKARYPVKVVVTDRNDSPSSPRTVQVLVFSYNSVFPGGRVADVHPNDADTSGQYHCRLLSGGAGLFSIPSGCDLTAAKVTGKESYTLSTSGNDGIHDEVTSTVTLQFSGFNNATLENSVVIRILNTTSEHFLSDLYRPLLRTISDLFESSDDVVIYSVTQTDDHVDLTLAVTNRAGHRPPTELVQRLKDGRVKMQRLLHTASFVINYDPCPTSPCKNGGQCQSGIRVSENSQTTDSPSLIFTSRQVRNLFTCQCQPGFTGPACQHKQNPCSPNPCQYGGVCAKNGYDFICTCPRNRGGKTCEQDQTSACDADPCQNGGACRATADGGFFCLCRPGYRGATCQLASDSCRPNPCLNGGSCVSEAPGYTCTCPPNFYGKHCQYSSWGFESLGFMTFPSLDASTNDISVTFSTNKPDGLLVYNYGVQTGGRSDFVAIQLVDGRPQLAYGGTRTAMTRVTLKRKVADARWYRLTATRNGRVVSLSVVTCNENGDTCAECRPGQAGCEYATDQGTVGTLNFNDEPMYVGGVMTIDPIQERPGQVDSDDFVGCIQSVFVNGRQLNMSAPIQARGISDKCQRVADACRDSPCGAGATCLDRWSRHVCLCPGGVMAPDCSAALEPSSFQGGHVEFSVTDRHRRRQLVPRLFQGSAGWRRRREVAARPDKTLSMRVRTVDTDGVVLYAATNNDFTLLQLKDSLLRYTSKVGANPVINMTVEHADLTDGGWHNLSLAIVDNTMRILVDEQKVGDALYAASVHDFLDAYLTELTLGGATRLPQTAGTPEAFHGCISTFSINGEVQPLNGTGELLTARPVGTVSAGCHGALPATDPLNIGITLVIVFFVILFVAIAVSFVVFRLRRHKNEKGTPAHAKLGGSGVMTQSTADSGRSHQDSGFAETGELTDEVLRGHLGGGLDRKYPPQRPDIIERQVVNRSPAGPQMSHIDSVSQQGVPDSVSEVPEHYDLENASSIAPSDIDVVYHYKGFRDGNVRRYKTNQHMGGNQYHKHNHRHSPHSFVSSAPHRESPRSMVRQSPNPMGGPRESPGAMKMQSTPLARLSPSSELSQQTPRILTLQDISGKPLPAALLSAAAVNSERSLNSPVSHLSRSSESVHTSSQSTKKKKSDGGGGGDMPARLHGRAPRNNSSLVNTVDAVSSGSEGRKKRGGREPSGAPAMERGSSSSDESGNDSFTCSEFEYENQYDKVARDFGPQNMIFSKLAEVDNENDHENSSGGGNKYGGFDSFRGSLSTLVASDDDISNIHSYKPANGSSLGWDYLLNWGPNFESLVGVFKDIAELPDSTGGGVSGRTSSAARNSGSTPKPSEEYV